MSRAARILFIFINLSQFSGFAQEGAADWLSRIWLSGQANFISQGHPTFDSPYQGPNSLSPNGQFVTSRVITVYTGFRITSTTDFFLDLEETGGHGIGDALGIAGFTNLDVVRNPTLGQAPYVARALIHQMIPLSAETTEADLGPLQLESTVPVRRLDIRAGKMSTVDWFDVNAIGSDSHLQFMNWAIDNNPAYDYAADTRGYTYALELEYTDRSWAFRFAEALMPKIANGTYLDADLARARAENLELEARGNRIAHRPGVVRLLSYLSHGNMGSYSDANAAFLAGKTTTP